MIVEYRTKEARILQLLRDLPSGGVTFERSDTGRLNKKIYVYGGGSARLSIKASIAKKLNDKINMEAIYVKGANGEEIIENLLGLGYFKEHYALLFVEEEEFFSMLGVKKPELLEKERA